MARNGKKWCFHGILTCFWHFSWIVAIFMFQKGAFRGSKSRPHKVDLIMSLFLLWGPLFMTGNGPKIFHFGPKMAKHDRLVNAPKWFKRVQMGPKWSALVFLIIWDPFQPFQTKNYFLVWSTSAKSCPFGATNLFLSEMVQIVHDILMVQFE